MTPAKDHPRRCGENGSRHKVWDAYEGSPPQVRGKRFAQYSSTKEVRITPAGAGKTHPCALWEPCH